MPFVTIPNTVFEAGKPIRAIDMRSLRDNLLATAAGEGGAPKVNGLALTNVFRGTRDITGNNFHNYTGLTAQAKQIRMEVYCESLTTIQALKISFSNNNGSSYGAEQNFANSSGSSSSDAWYILYVDLETGGWSVVSGSEFSTGLSGTFTVPANCNALRIRQDPCTTDVNSSLMILSGRA